MGWLQGIPRMLWWSLKPTDTAKPEEDELRPDYISPATESYDAFKESLTPHLDTPSENYYVEPSHSDDSGNHDNGSHEQGNDYDNSHDFDSAHD